LESGQAINLPKSKVFFSTIVPSPMKDAITNILRVRAVMGMSKYLGPKLTVGEVFIQSRQKGYD